MSECKICQKSFSSNWHLKRHMTNKHPDVKFVPFRHHKKCIICNESFTARNSNAKLCSNKCAVISYRKRHPERVKTNRKKRTNTDEYRAKHNAYEKMRTRRPEVKEKLIAKRKERYANGGLERQKEIDDQRFGKPPKLNCCECGVEFQSPHRIRKKPEEHSGKWSNTQKYCSKSCKLKRDNRVRRETPKGVISMRVRRSINHYLKKYKMSKGGKTFNLLGYTPLELANHIESQFTDGMSWDNTDKWHIDHIRPVASFNFDSTDHPDFKKCWSLDNLQPLWAEDNLSKGDTWDGITNA